MARARRCAGLAAIALAGGCVSHTSSSRPAPSTSDSKAVPGLALDLQEIVDGESIPHPADDLWRDHLQEVDTRSTLRLTFHAPRPGGGVAESPEWKRLEAAALRLDARLKECQALAHELTDRSGRRGDETGDLAARAAEFRRREKEFVASLAETAANPAEGGPLLTRDELALVSADPDGPCAGLAKWLAQESADLAARARTAAAEHRDVLVTVRARLQPAIGLEQWLQVPGYWEKKGDQPADDTSRFLSAETEQLRAEFAAASRLEIALRELRRSGAAIGADLRLAVAAARDRIIARLRELADSRGRPLHALLERKPEKLDGRPAAEREFWAALAKLSAAIDAARDDWRDLVAAAETRTPREQLGDAAGALDRLEARRGEIEADGAAVAAAAAAALAAAPDDLKPQIATLQHDLVTSWKSSLEGIDAAHSAARGALAAAQPLVEAGQPLLVAVDRLPSDLEEKIPRPPGELPPVDLDLKRQPVNPGDRLNLEVAFFDRDEFVNAREEGRSPETLETIRYSNSAMKSGWLWSGDLIFAQQINGPNHDFSSTAAVSYERHWRDRDDPRGLANLIDPGLGFHAAALNFDPDVAVEFGLGVNASVLGGLIRAGVGYDVSISRDREYWFVGFSLVTTLETMKSVGSKAFGY
jgi:hypothetical protein